MSTTTQLAIALYNPPNRYFLDRPSPQSATLSRCLPVGVLSAGPVANGQVFGVCLDASMRYPTASGELQ